MSNTTIAWLSAYGACVVACLEAARFNDHRVAIPMLGATACALYMALQEE